MKRITCILLACSLAVAARGETTDEKARAEAVEILSGIGETCETKGLEACEPNLRGMEPLFAYVRAIREMEKTEGEFVAFVRTRYSMPDFTMDKMAAHLKVSANVTVNRHTFARRVLEVTRVPGGYDVRMEDGLAKLRRENDMWVAYAPQPKEDANMATIRRYTLGAKLKRVIMIYRRMEAEMRDYDLEAFATRFVADLGPIAVATLQKEDMITQMPDWQQRAKRVIEFYSRFDTVDDMRADILANKKSGE